VAAGAAVGVGVLLKLLPAVLLLPLGVYLGRRSALRLIATAGTVVVLGYGFAVAAGLAPLGSLLQFFAEWRFGSPLHAAVEQLMGGEALRVIIPLAGLGAALLIVALAQSAYAFEPGRMYRHRYCFPYPQNEVGCCRFQY
jgi:hypothetical protein